MKRLGIIAATGQLIGLAALCIELFYFNSEHFFYVLAAWFLCMFIFSMFIKKKSAIIKEQEQNELALKIESDILLPNPGLYPYMEFYYSKNVSLALFIAYIFITGFFSFADSLTAGWFFHFCMSLTVALCVLCLWYNYKKWLCPAFRNEPTISIDDKSIDLKNGYTPILWNEIDSIIIRQNVIGIKLKNLDEFLNKQPTKRKAFGLKFYRSFYRYNFGISLIIIRDGDINLFNTLTDYFNRFKNNY